MLFLTSALAVTVFVCQENRGHGQHPLLITYGQAKYSSLHFTTIYVLIILYDKTENYFPRKHIANKISFEVISL